MLEALGFTLSRCSECRKCCLFTEAELVDAPLFTTATRDRVLAEFSDIDLHFSPVGRLWRIRLHRARDPHLWVCPLYDQETAACRIHAYKPFDCWTWPFYVMRRDDQLVITCSTTCPIAGEHGVEELANFVKSSGLAREMADAARRYPELVAAYRVGLQVLVELD